MRIKHAPVLLAATLALALTACGSVEDGGDAAESTTTSAASGPVTLTDARDKEIKLDAPATKVVGLEWGVVENLVSLGVMPIGVADVKGYSHWVSAAPLDDSVKDVGMRGEPSVDALVALDPELVITTTDLPEPIINQIEKAIPVLVIRGAAAEDPIGQMRENLSLTAEAVGKTAEARALLDELDQKIGEGKQAIADAEKAGKEFTLADGWVEGSALSIRMFTPGSLAGAIGEELGLKNAWTAKGDPDYGLAQTDVEGLTKLGDIEFIYYANDADGGDPYESVKDNAIWKQRPFVKNGHVHRLKDGIWMFGGPASVEQLIDALVETVTAE